jgi:uncharacterized membrane protein
MTCGGKAMLLERHVRTWQVLGLVVLGVSLLVLLVAVDPTHMLRGLAALAVLVLPSYLIAWPVLRPQLGAAGAFTIAGGLSLGMVAIAGLVLNLLPWGIQAATWLAYVVALVVIAWALGRRPRVRRPTLNVARHEVVLAVAGGMIMVTALLSARMFAGYPAESFTQLWITSSVDAPTTGVAVTVRSEEHAVTSYRLELWIGSARVETWADIRLGPGQTWSRTVTVGSGRIEAQLYRLVDPGTLYRRVTLQLSSTPQALPQGGT